MVNILKVLGGLVVFAGLIYGVGALLNVSYLADPELEHKYPTLFAEHTAAQNHDATVSVCAFGASILIFGFASLLQKVAQIEHHLRPNAPPRADIQLSPQDEKL